LRYASPEKIPASTTSVLLVVLNEEEAGTKPAWVDKIATSGQAVVLCEPRGVGATKWTRRNGPNYVERSHVLLGRTVDSGRVWDVAAAAKYLAAEKLPVSVAGGGAAGVIAAYAASWAPEIASVTLVAPSRTHGDATAPQLLNVLRVCDIPQALGLVAPRPLTILTASAGEFAATSAAYRAASAAERLSIRE
jgi:hypothetical protein